MPSAVLSARHDAGGELQLVSIAVDHEVARAYTTPGQYIQLKTALGDGYFVLASAVGEAPWQLLVKHAAGAAEALATLPLGSALSIEGPLGAGFPIARMSGRHVVVAVVASALGVARAVLARRIADGAASATHVFVGLRAPTDLPIPEEVRAWTESGVIVVLCLSRAELHHHAELLPKAKRVAGYVQHAVARALDAAEVPHGALVVAAGPDAMLADLRGLAGAREGGGSGAAQFPPGTKPARIEVLTNV